VAVGVAAWLWWRSDSSLATPAITASDTPTTAAANSEPSAAIPSMIGNATACRAIPKYTQALGFGSDAFLSTSERTLTGLALIAPGKDGGERRTYQHPSWTSAGYLGPTALDKEGNLYVAPAPRVNLIDNPLENQNTLYRVDSNSQEMARLIQLPALRPPSQQNPYGILGLAYDCETNSLYISSVAGSTRKEEIGRIYRVDLGKGAVAAQLENVDAIGLAVFNGVRDKRLYFASARNQEIRSLVLDTAGNFMGTPRSELSLAGLGPDGNDKGRRISFAPGTDANYYMVINGAKFNYNLAPPPSTAIPTVYRFRYNTADDTWSLYEVGSTN
jgi:hypothetical protein